MAPIPVVLLKSSSRSCSTSAPDPYAHLLSASSSFSRQPSYSAAFLEVFQTELMDDELERVLREGPGRWRGVVVSSQRSVEGWASVGARVGSLPSAESKGKGKGRSIELEDHPASWSNTPFFSIGPSTTASLLSLSNSLPDHLCPSEELIVGTDTAGNTPALARVIADYFSREEEEEADDDRPLLYLTGDKNSTVLEELLQEATSAIQVVPLQVYATSAAPSFDPSFRSLFSSLVPPRPPATTPSESTPSDPGAGAKPWLVLFSPSAIPLVLPLLREHDPSAITRLRFALIGPTTASAFERAVEGEEGVEWVMSPRPTAGELVRVLRDRDGLL